MSKKADRYIAMLNKADEVYQKDYSTGEYCHEQSFKWGFQEGYEQAEKDLGWISVKDRLPEERKYESDTLQGHHEWTESDRVFVLDDRGVAMVDSLRNGKFWLDGKKDCDSFPHYIEYWMPIPKLPEK